jgi:chromosome segregation and condensation protein ScpB
MAAGGPLTLDQILGLYPDEQRPAAGRDPRRRRRPHRDYQGRGIELVEVAGGWRIQVRREVAPWVGAAVGGKPARYSRALLETLALIAYRQPITRGEIEDIRGVAVSTQIVKTLSEREWVRVVGHRDVPGRPRPVRHHAPIPGLFRAAFAERPAAAGGDPRPGLLADALDRGRRSRCGRVRLASAPGAGPEPPGGRSARPVRLRGRPRCSPIPIPIPIRLAIQGHAKPTSTPR